MGMLISKLILIISMILSMPFFTLYERKILGYIQNRKGPNKVSFLGMLQPIFDGMKLVIKESSFPMFSKIQSLFLFSFGSFFLMILLWLMTPFYNSYFMIKFTILIIIFISSIKVYKLMGAGWSSKSKFSLLGSVRGAAQSVSYEVSLVFLILIPSVILVSYKLWDFYNKSFSGLMVQFKIMFCWLVVMVAETNRAPFDFAEGESELVSGFKTEYSSLMFAFMFLGEYGSILWMSFITLLLFLKMNWLLIWLSMLMLSFWYVWIRGSFPRFRYDMLMSLAWKLMLPMSLSFLSLIVMLS